MILYTYTVQIIGRLYYITDTFRSSLIPILTHFQQSIADPIYTTHFSKSSVRLLPSTRKPTRGGRRHPVAEQPIMWSLPPKHQGQGDSQQVLTLSAVKSIDARSLFHYHWGPPSVLPPNNLYYKSKWKGAAHTRYSLSICSFRVWGQYVNHSKELLLIWQTRGRYI